MTVAPISEHFVRSLERFVAVQGLDLVTFEKGQRKDDLAQQYLAAFEGEEGVLFVGKAQEKAMRPRPKPPVRTRAIGAPASTGSVPQTAAAADPRNGDSAAARPLQRCAAEPTR